MGALVGLSLSNGNLCLGTQWHNAVSEAKGPVSLCDTHSLLENTPQQHISQQTNHPLHACLLEFVLHVLSPGDKGKMLGTLTALQVNV